jgi:hypothetical protein|tara:strand:+ start:317 stop:1144 length:828 start_codon:yes stop_codon:yes gene_type:complete
MRQPVGSTPQVIPAGSFDPKTPGRFAATPEVLDTIQRIKDKHGLEVKIEPMPAYAPSWAAGLYMTEGPGGSYDPETRTVYLGENPDLFTLEHELGHALDPTLTKSTNFERELQNQFFDKLNKGELRTPAERLKAHMLGTPRRKLDTELTAQKYALERMKEKGLEDDRTRGDLRLYPLAYIDQGIRTSQRGEMMMDGRDVPDSVALIKHRVFDRPYGDVYSGQVETSFMPNANTVVDYSDSVANTLLKLALDKNYQKAANKEKDRAVAYATRRMGY